MKEIKIELRLYIIMIVAMIIGACTLVYANVINVEKEEQIKELEQNNIEQTEEKEVYINRCKMLEELIKENGITLDECECR